MAGEFAERLNGRFHGILAWRQLDALWEQVRAAPDGWYVTLVGKPHETDIVPVSAGDLDRFVCEVDVLLRKEHREDYCGIVYVDDPAEPALIKIYDPSNLGSSCGTQAGRIQPRWILSRMRPESLEDAAPLPGNRLRWWQTLFCR